MKWNTYANPRTYKHSYSSFSDHLAHYKSLRLWPMVPDHRSKTKLVYLNYWFNDQIKAFIFLPQRCSKDESITDLALDL